MEHRRRSASIRPRCQISPSNSDQFDCTKAASEALYGHALRWWTVTYLLYSITVLLVVCSSWNRFIPQSVAEKYDLDIPDYQGVDQIAELGGNGTKSKEQEVIGLAERQG